MSHETYFQTSYEDLFNKIANYSLIILGLMVVVAFLSGRHVRDFMYEKKVI